jgi:hypothetical protein
MRAEFLINQSERYNRDFISPKHRKLFAHTYFETAQIAKNREAFADAHGLVKYVKRRPAWISSLLSLARNQNYVGGGVYDHVELYKTGDGDFVLVISPYCLRSPHKPVDRLFGVPFVETDQLYSNDATTYYKKFPNRKPTKSMMLQWGLDQMTITQYLRF